MGLVSCEAKMNGGWPQDGCEDEFQLQCGMELGGRGGESDGSGEDEGQG